MKKHLSVFAFFFALSFLPLAQANDTAPCHADREKFCKNVQQGEGRVLECMKSHEADLSTECLAQLGNAGERKDRKEKFEHHRQMMDQACHTDKEKYCSDPGLNGEIFPCLRSHMQDLSSECRAMMGQKKQ